MEQAASSDLMRVRDRLKADPDGALTVIKAVTLGKGRRGSVGRVRNFRISTDQPSWIGGDNGGPTPVELLLAAVGAGVENTYKLYAEDLGITLDHLAVEVEGRLDLRGLSGADRGVRPGLKDVRATVIIQSSASDGDLARLRAAAEQACPLLGSLRCVTPVGTSLRRDQIS
jgi:uncharacterized OsmC-like protein